MHEAVKKAIQFCSGVCGACRDRQVKPPIQLNPPRAPCSDAGLLHKLGLGLVRWFTTSVMRAHRTVCGCEESNRIAPECAAHVAIAR